MTYEETTLTSSHEVDYPASPFAALMKSETLGMLEVKLAGSRIISSSNALRKYFQWMDMDGYTGQTLRAMRHSGEMGNPFQIPRHVTPSKSAQVQTRALIVFRVPVRVASLRGLQNTQWGNTGGHRRKLSSANSRASRRSARTLRIMQGANHRSFAD